MLEYDVINMIDIVLLFQRLLPIEGQNDMFPPPNREPPATKVYTVRPYFSEDKVLLLYY